jgi:hypothetical protein
VVTRAADAVTVLAVHGMLLELEFDGFENA